MPFVVRQLPQATVLIAGYDPWGYGRVLDSLTERQHVERHVRLTGFQNDIPSFLHAVDVFAFASRSEGFGQVVIEAMVAGKPVVVPRIAPLTEIVVDRQTGLCVEPESPAAFAEAIIWLLSSPKEAQRMGQQGRERVRELFSADRMAHQVVEIYELLLSAPKG